MALVLNDRVKETTTTTGTGTINLAGAETGFETFVQGVGNSNTTYYAIVHTGANEFEVGLGTVTDASPDTLSRTTIISSTNSDSAVDFSAGTKNVFCTLPASKATVRDSNDNITFADNDKILFGAGTDLAIFSDGTDGNIEATGDIILDADGGDIRVKDGGTQIGTITNSSSDFKLTSSVQDKDILFAGNDGGSGVTALTLDMSDAGRAIFGGGIDIVANLDIVLNDGTWTGEKDRKIQAHGGHIYYQSASHIFRKPSGTNTCQVDGSGNFISVGNITAYGSISDERLKENIEVIENPIDKIKNLKGVTFNYKKDGSKSTGLIAQDLEKVLPEAVYTAETIGDEFKGEEPEEHLAIRYGNTVGLLVEAIKELEARVKELEDK